MTKRVHRHCIPIPFKGFCFGSATPQSGVCQPDPFSGLENFGCLEASACAWSRRNFVLTSCGNSKQMDHRGVVGDWREGVAPGELARARADEKG